MDFSKLAAQRAAKEQAATPKEAVSEPEKTKAQQPEELLEQALEETAKAQAKTDSKAGRPRSKRQGWKAATFYLKPETLAQLRRVVGLRKLEGEKGDLSDAVEEALQAWLAQAEKN